MDISPAGCLHAALFLVFVPWLVLKSKRALDAGARLPDTVRMLRGTLVAQLAFIALGLAVVKADWLDLFPAQAPTARDVLIAFGTLAFLVATMPLRWRFTPPEARRRMAHAMPQGSREFLLWVPVALCAGFGEELNYRGVLVTELHIATGNFWLGAALSALAFAVGHATQGWRKAGWILLFTALAQGLVLATGTLYLAMAVHAVYDLIAGAVFGRWTAGLRESPASAGPRAAA